MKLIKKWFGVTLLVMLITLLSGAVDAQEGDKFGTVSGTVSYTQKIALPDDAEIIVWLVDIPQVDVPGTVITTQIILAKGRQVPFDYSLNYEIVSIDPAGNYVITAQIYANNTLAWISDTSNPVINNGQFTTDIGLIPISPSEPATEQAPMTEEPSARFGTVTGTIFYLQRIALPEYAVVQIQLTDVSRADAPSFVLATQQFITHGRQVPLPFALNYDLASVNESGTYTVSAKIYVDGALRWTSDTSNPVISNGITNIDVRLVQVSV